MLASMAHVVHVDEVLAGPAVLGLAGKVLVLCVCTSAFAFASLCQGVLCSVFGLQVATDGGPLQVQHKTAHDSCNVTKINQAAPHNLRLSGSAEL